MRLAVAHAVIVPHAFIETVPERFSPSASHTQGVGSREGEPSRAPPPRPPPCASLDGLLLKHFGIERFHPWQREAVEALVYADATAYSPEAAAGRSGRVLVVAPTGGGKSICYQLPAIALPGTALVLSPLISLMEDQVRALLARGIPATFVASTLPRDENGRRLAGLRRGEYKIVYAAPERLAFDGFLDALGASDLSLVAVDEAHCIVQWGHDFRPDYLRIGGTLARIRPPRVLACTATATPDMREEIVRRLGFADGRFTTILRGFARPNLHLRVEEVDGQRDAIRLVEDALRDALGPPAAPRGAGIVYAATRKRVEKLAEELRRSGWDATPYHAGLSPEARADLSAAFAERRVSVVVATNAFGMGIDRPDVRVVVHAQPPSSIEAYYQEVGRAGRDGAPAYGLLLLAGVDIALRRRLSAVGADGAPASPTDAARAWKLFRELLRYIDAATCRHDFILRHFGDEAESLGGCGHCDVCLSTEARDAAEPEASARDLDVIRRALAGVARARGGAGMQAIAAMLVGEDTERVRRLGLDRLSTFGVLPGLRVEDATAILRVLLANGWIDLTDSEFPVPLVTSSGWRVMKGDHSVRVKLPVPRKRGRNRKVAAWKQKLSLSRATESPAPGTEANVARARARTGHAARSEAAASTDGACILGVKDAALFEALRAHRAALAREKSVPPYVIAHDRTLTEIALLRPRSAEELRMAHGMGPLRIATYGDGFLRIVREHTEVSDRWDG